jgi:hypothetical protein
MELRYFCLIIDSVRKFIITLTPNQMKKKYPSFFSFSGNPKRYMRFGLKNAIFTLLCFFNAIISNSQCPTPPGDQTTYGNESWIGYVYFGTPSDYVSDPPTTAFASGYYTGYVTQTPHFDQDYEYDAVWGSTICSGQNNNFAIRYKMTKYYAAGSYTFTVGGDDGYRLSIDGGATYLISNWIEHGYVSSSATTTLAAGYYNLVFEYYEDSGGSRVSYFDTSCTTYSTAPTTITGTTTICKGSTTTFTASGGVAAPGSVYQWGYGTTAGYYIMNGQTGNSVTVGPNQNENIWVRRIDAGSCSNTTLCTKTYLTVLTPSTAPTTVSGTTTICPGESTTLTASGGTSASGAVFQWGTGTVGSNVISGQTSASITVSPAATTTYWVRRSDNSPCTYTSAVSQTVTVSIAPGNPAVFGNNVWNLYGYTNADITLATTTYVGYYVQNSLSFNTQSGSTAWNSDYSPSIATGWNGCTLPNDNFTFVHKRKGFPCGNYTVTMTDWDDSCIIYIDGVQQWYCQNWSSPGSCNGYVGEFALNEDSTIEVRTSEGGGGAHAGISLTNNSVAATAPTSITGSSAICQGNNVVLTAAGGSSGTNSSYQWGTGATVGSNIISGQTASSITVTPSADTTYWVRRVDGSTCPAYTSGITASVAVTVPAGNPAAFGNNLWNVYGYSNRDLTLATAVYSGYYTQVTLGFDTQSGANSWNSGSSPASVEGWSGCTLDSDYFTFVYKRKGFPCGNYTVAMTNWDDAAVLYVDGVQQWSCASWSQPGGCNGYVGEIMLNENSEIEVRVREDGGFSYASLSLVNNTVTVPGTLSPSGSTTICAGTRPGAITLSGHSGSVVKWQSAEDAAFTIGVTDIASTSSVLTSINMGPISATRFYRAVVQNGICDPQYPTPAQIIVPLPATYTNGAWSSTPTATTPIVVEADLTVNSNLNVCSCRVKNGKTLSIGANTNLTVATSVTVETGAQLIIEDTGSLVQIEDAAVNSGDIKMKRKSQPMKTYDYTYWSSAVQNNTLYQLSPLTQIDKFYRFDPIINNWVSISGGAQVMEPGKGYIVRAPNGWAVDNATSGVYGAEFNGVPNNGIIPATIQKGAGVYNLIGNPYPSAIDIDLFLTDPANAAIVNGTVYLWTHNTAISSSIPGNSVYNYTADDYAKYNLTGGIRTADAAITGGNIPDGKIASGQGFFIETATGLANGTYSVNFKNSMRITGSNDHFCRANQAGTQNTNALEKNRFWLNISNNQGAYSQTLVGYITNATNGVDALFDGRTMASANVLSMYSVIGTDNYSIQGRALPFADNDVVPLGYKTNIAGSFTIALDNFDGIFQGQNIYLVDKLNNVVQDLKTGSYTFASDPGAFNQRFEIRYTNTTLETAAVTFNENNISVAVRDKQVSVHASVTIESISIFDLLGRKVYSNDKINALQFVTPQLLLPTQALIVKLKARNLETTRKIILHGGSN